MLPSKQKCTCNKQHACLIAHTQHPLTAKLIHTQQIHPTTLLATEMPPYTKLLSLESGPHSPEPGLSPPPAHSMHACEQLHSPVCCLYGPTIKASNLTSRAEQYVFPNKIKSFYFTFTGPVLKHHLPTNCVEYAPPPVSRQMRGRLF